MMVTGCCAQGDGITVHHLLEQRPEDVDLFSGVGHGSSCMSALSGCVAPFSIIAGRISTLFALFAGQG
jgi:hypothetical protein